MQKLVAFIVCLLLASTLAICLSCQKKEGPPEPAGETTPLEDVQTAPAKEVAPAAEERH